MTPDVAKRRILAATVTTLLMIFGVAAMAAHMLGR